MRSIIFQHIRPATILLVIALTSCISADQDRPVTEQQDRPVIEQQDRPVIEQLDRPVTEQLAYANTSTISKINTDISKLIFLDSFEYEVKRDNDPNGYNTFRQRGGWSHAKAVNLTGSHAGYLYTVNRIPGYTGKFPGKESKTVLAIEARPGSLETQTDFYLQYGDEQAPENTVPGNVWFQFWIYPNHFDDPTDKEDQLSSFGHRFKFIYPCNGPYPCRKGKMNWLHTMGYTTGEPFWLDVPKTDLFMTTIDPFDENIRYLNAPKWNQFKIGQTDTSEHIVPNRWTLVKIHYDTSTSSGTFEAWLKPMGGKWKKVAEWVNGKTPNFEWKISSKSIGGHRVFRMPTTLDVADSWIYLDDFAMATSENKLPQY